MALWDDLPADLRNSGGVEALQPVLSSVATPTKTTETDTDGTWDVYTSSVGGSGPLSLDPATGRFTRGQPSGASPLVFPDPLVGVELRLHLSTDGEPDGWVRLIVSTSRLILRPSFLRGAKLDQQGQLRADPNNPHVSIHLPALRVQVERTPQEGIGTTILSASTTDPVDEIYEFIRMEPPHALIGPGDTVGFAFRTAVLDLSGTSGPSGVPANARAMPGDWQGLYLPDARLFVAPSGLEGLAVSGGIQNMWIGIGEHAGVTGVFLGEVVDRGNDPTVRLRFQTPTGEWIGVPDPTSSTPVELPEQARLYVDAGGGLAPHTFSITVDGTTTSADRVDVTTPATGSRSITARVSDAGGHETTHTISVTRRASTTPSPAPSGTQPVTLSPTSSGYSRIELVSDTGTQATVRIMPPGGTTSWSWTGGSTGTATGDTATIDVAAAQTIAVTATRELDTEIDCFMRFDRPEPSQGDTWAENPANTRTEAAPRDGAWTAGRAFHDAASLGRFTSYPTGTTWSVEGYASFEGDNSPGKQTYNTNLSARRRDALVHILTTEGVSGVSAGTAHGHEPARVSTAPLPGSGSWWRATATATLPGGMPAKETVTADLTRPTTPASPPDVDPTPTPKPVPDCFRKIGFEVELVRGTFVRAEVYGEFDVYTAAEQRLAANSAQPLPARDNDMDGVCSFLVRLRIAEDRSSWDVFAEFRGHENDLDGLAKTTASPPGSQAGVNVLGAVAALAPLMAAATPPSPDEGELMPLAVVGATALGLGGSGALKVAHVILRGGELLVTDGLVDPDDDTGPRTTQVSVMLDVETAFTFDLGFIKVKPGQVVTTRYQAVGLRSTWTTETTPQGVQYVPLPVFDPSRGYTLDVPSGALVAASPLDEVLRVLGVRVSRDNPTYLEVEIGMDVDLGVITIENARVRLRIDQAEPPQLTKLAASLEIPGTLRGRGQVEITSSGFSGAFDISVVPLELRVAATLKVDRQDGVTGVLVGAEVEFPVPLPLGSSGLGIYGFLGGAGINFARDEPANVPAPALSWLEQQLRGAGVMDPNGWQLEAGSFAFAAGMLVGTLEGGYLVHLKGVVLLEVPGPRLLLVMKADVLKAPPVLDSDAEATFLAVLDIDFGRGTITVGVVASYEIKELLTIRVPVTAFFSTRDSSDWFVDLGTFDDPVTVHVLDVISGVGYLMIHGDSIENLPIDIVTSGLTIAVGFHISAILMGSKAARLYLEVAAGFDAVVSFEPFAIGGTIYARGELRLFIISIGASATLTVLVGRQLVNGQEVDRTYIHGEACGKVDFFFFSISGCVSLTIGDQPPSLPPAPDLAAGVVLIERTPGVLEGSAVGRSVDGKIADAVESSTSNLPTVPLDAIPVVLLSAPAEEAPGDIVLGGTARGPSGLGADPWVRRGDRWWRYRITSVTLSGPLTPTDGATPATWWRRGVSTNPPSGPALALLDWVPEPQPRAVVYGETLTTRVTEEWGTICQEPSEPTPVLWTFDDSPTGPSPLGWRLRGIAWPDAPDTWRSSSRTARLTVTELWRTGDDQIDRLQGTDPAVVVGDVVGCPDPGITVVDSAKDWLLGQPPEFSGAHPQRDTAATEQVAALLAAGVSLLDVETVRAEQAWDPDLDDSPATCDGRVLRSPQNDEDSPGGTTEIEQASVAEHWETTGHTPSDLENAVRLTCADGFDQFTVLLLLPDGAEDAFRLRFLDDTETVLNEQQVGGTMVSGGNPIPSRWSDPGGPWFGPVGRSGALAARIGSLIGHTLHLVRGRVPTGTVTVDLGWRRDLLRGRQAAPFHVVAVEAVTAAEVRRHDWDRTTTDRTREVISTTLDQDPDEHALLQPSQTYTVRVAWEALSVESEDPPPTTPPDWSEATSDTQEFSFATEAAAQSPTDLTPWLLATTPGPDEVGVLCAEPVEVVLSTQKVTALFKAYGKELRVVVRSATGRHPVPPGSTVPGAAVTIPTVPSPTGVLQPLSSENPVLTPWEQAVREVVASLTCVPSTGTRTDEHVVTIAYDFDPLTDYLLDIRAVDAGAGTGAQGDLVHRVGFTTSRFATIDDLARLVADAPVLHSYVAQPADLLGLPDRPSGPRLDEAFQNAGLPVPSTPRYPRVEVLWSGGTVPQPVAVIVDSSETLWRSRPAPTQTSDTTSGSTPPPTWWVSADADWLHPEVSTDPAAPGDPPRTSVSRVIRCPGDTRALLLPSLGSRGSELLVDLVSPAASLGQRPQRRARLLQVALDRAPWEVGQ